MKLQWQDNLAEACALVVHSSPLNGFELECEKVNTQLENKLFSLFPRVK